MADRTPSWFADPHDPALARWHDGRGWTGFTMVVAEWTASEAPPPPAGWSPDTSASPTSGLTPAFGTPAGPAAPASAPIVPAPPPVMAPTPTTPTTPTVAPPEPAETPTARPPASGVRITAPVADPEPRHTDRGLEPAAPVPAFGPPPVPTAPAPVDDPIPDGADTDPAAGDPAAFDHEAERHGGHGPEAPGPDWGSGAELARPVLRRSGWNDDPEDDYIVDEASPGPLDRFLSSPPIVRIGLPLAAIAAIVLLAFQLTARGDDDGDGPFGNGDGSLQAATADEPGMNDALEVAREGGSPKVVSDQKLADLIKGVCSAARRSLVPLNLSEGLASSGVDATDLEAAATAIGVGAIEFCPDQDSTIPQVVSVLIARTQRMLETDG